MWWKFLSVASVIAIIAVISAPVVAADVDLFAGPQFNFSDQYRRSAEVRSGAYLRIPFSGGLRRSLSGTRFGLTLSARLPGQYRYSGRAAPRYAAKRLDLSIGLRGRETIRLNGLSLTDKATLRAGTNGKEEEQRMWPWFLGGMAGTVGVLLIIGLATSS